MHRAVLWDLDGTLVDSAEFHFESWEEALAAEGRTIARADFVATFGQRNDRILAQWLGSDVPPHVVARIADAKEAAYRRMVRERGIDPLPGAADWLAYVDAQGWKQAIATSAPRLNVEVVLEVLRWAPYFGAVVSGEDVRAGKPDPEVFLTAAARLAVPASACIVVEDAEAGIEAARRAGMRAIGVAAAAAADPDVAVASLTELTEATWIRLATSRDLP
jgi:beta-phosphoglucomutase